MPKQELILKTLRFGLVGGLSAATFVGLTSVFAHWWGKQAGFLAAYPVALLVHFLLNKWWTFASHEPVSARQVRGYVLLALLNFAIQWLVYTVVVTVTRLPVSVATVLTIGSQMTVSFFGMERLIFVRDPAGSAKASRAAAAVEK